jgi:hypothetical protein
MLRSNGPNRSLAQESDMTTTMTRNHVEQIVPAAAPARGGRRWVRRSIAGLAHAGGLAVLGSQMTANANFSEHYVTEQLARQRITFKAASTLTDEERKHDCVVANAGKPLLTGKQAECYANEFIGTHVIAIGKGRTYAELEDVRSALTAQIATAQANGDPELGKLQKDLGDLTGQREALFKAEMLRGALLTSFGFSTLGEKAGQAADVAYAGAGVVALLSIAGLGLSRRTAVDTDRR